MYILKVRDWGGFNQYEVKDAHEAIYILLNKSNKMEQEVYNIVRDDFYDNLEDIDSLLLLENVAEHIRKVNHRFYIKLIDESDGEDVL